MLYFIVVIDSSYQFLQIDVIDLPISLRVASRALGNHRIATVPVK